MIKSILAAAVISASAAGAAHAAVLDFNAYTGAISVSNGTYDEDGFQFAFGSSSFIFQGSNSNFNGFSSPVMELDSSTASLTKIGGGLFDFTSVRVNQSGTTVPLTFTGVFANDTTIVSQIFASEASVVDAAVETFAGFVGIKGLTISAVGNSFALFDDFTVDAATSPVPLPASLPLALLGVCALWGLRRRAA